MEQEKNKIGFVDMLPILQVSSGAYGEFIGTLQECMDFALEKASTQTLKLGKKSTIKLTLDIAMLQDNKFQIKPKITMSLPEYDLDEARSFYRDDRGNITLENPRQARMFDANGEVANPLRRINAAA